MLIFLSCINLHIEFRELTFRELSDRYDDIIILNNINFLFIT